MIFLPCRSLLSFIRSYVCSVTLPLEFTFCLSHAHRLQHYVDKRNTRTVRGLPHGLCVSIIDILWSVRDIVRLFHDSTGVASWEFINQSFFAGNRSQLTCFASPHLRTTICAPHIFPVAFNHHQLI